MPGRWHDKRHSEPEPEGLPEGNIVSEFPDILSSLEEATRPTGKAAVIDAEGRETGTIIHRHPEGGDRYAWGTREGPTAGYVSGDTIETVGREYGDKGYRPVR